MKHLQEITDRCQVEATLMGQNKKVTLTINTSARPVQIPWIGKRVGDVLTTTSGLSYLVEKIYVGEAPTPTKKRNIYFVFQNQAMFAVQFVEGYLWAPANSSQHHWNRMEKLMPGDVILHSVGAMIFGISVVSGSCEEYMEPIALSEKTGERRIGRMVKSDYTQIKSPIVTSNYKEEIKELCKGKMYQPFNKNGTGNDGYLFEIDRRLAKLFISETAKKNECVAKLDYVVEILAE